MGSCFRWKKKNSYTVSHDEEYSISGGKYNPHREPYVLRSTPTEIPTASNTAAKKWAAESRDGVETNQNVPETNDRASIPASNDRASDPVAKEQEDRNPKQKEVIKENGFHKADDDSRSDRSSPPASRKVDEDRRSELEEAEGDKHEQVEVSDQPYETIQVGDVVSNSSSNREENKFGAELTSDIQLDSPTTAEAAVTEDANTESPSNFQRAVFEVEDAPTIDTAAYEIQTETVPSTEEPVIAVQEDDESGEDDREDPVQVREDYFRERQLEEQEAALTEKAEYGEEDSDQSQGLHPDVDVVPEMEEVRITDSPAGTWDARLNRDVCAEMEEQQRSSLANSKSNSDASLDVNPDRRDDDGVASADAVVVQRVQFDLSADHERGNDVTVSDVTYVVSEEGTLQYAGNETYSPPDGSQLQEALDNDFNAHLDAERDFGAGHYLGEAPKEDGVIELSDELAISYEDPYSSSAHTDVAVRDGSP